MTKAPPLGAIVQIGAHPPQLVVLSEHVVSPAYDGDYHKDRFKTIDLTDIGVADPPETEWTLADGSMSGPNPVDPADIRVVARMRFRRRITYLQEE
jgi:hypothetical protein